MRVMGPFGIGGGRIVGTEILVLKWPLFGLVHEGSTIITLFLKLRGRLLCFLYHYKLNMCFP